MAKCIRCGENVSMWSSRPFYLCGTEQTMCPDCFAAYEQAYEITDDTRKIALIERLARSPDLKHRETVLQRLSVEKEKFQRAASAKLLAEQAAAQRRAHIAAFASCCGQPMTELGVSTFQLGEHTFLGGDWDHLVSGSMKMAVFRCDCCGQLKMFDPEYMKKQ